MHISSVGKKKTQHSHRSAVEIMKYIYLQHTNEFHGYSNLNVCYWQLQFILSSQDSPPLTNRLPLARYLSLRSAEQHYWC